MDAVLTMVTQCSTFQTLEIQLLTIDRISRIVAFLPDLITAGVFGVLQSLQKERNFKDNKGKLTVMVY